MATWAPRSRGRLPRRVARAPGRKSCADHTADRPHWTPCSRPRPERRKWPGTWGRSCVRGWRVEAARRQPKTSFTRRSAIRGALGRIRMTSLRRPALRWAFVAPPRGSRPLGPAWREGVCGARHRATALAALLPPPFLPRGSSVGLVGCRAQQLPQGLRRVRHRGPRRPLPHDARPARSGRHEHTCDLHLRPNQPAAPAVSDVRRSSPQPFPEAADPGRATPHPWGTREQQRRPHHHDCRRPASRSARSPGSSPAPPRGDRRSRHRRRRGQRDRRPAGVVDYPSLTPDSSARTSHPRSIRPALDPTWVSFRHLRADAGCVPGREVNTPAPAAAASGGSGGAPRPATRVR